MPAPRRSAWRPWRRTTRVAASKISAEERSFVPSLPPTTSTCPSSIVVAVALTRAVDIGTATAALSPVAGSKISAPLRRETPSEPPTISTRPSRSVAAACSTRASVMSPACNRRPGRRIIDFDVERGAVRSRSAGEQHPAVLQQRRGVTGPCHGETAGGRPRGGRRIEREHAARQSAVDRAASHQHASVRKRHGCGTGRNGPDLSGGHPRAARHLRDIRAQDEPRRSRKQGHDWERGPGPDVPCRATDIRGVVHIVLSFLISLKRACNDRCSWFVFDRLSNVGPLATDTDRSRRRCALVRAPLRRGISVLRAKCCVADGIASSGPRAVARHDARGRSPVLQENSRICRRTRPEGRAVVARVKSGRRRTFRAATTRLSILLLPPARTDYRSSPVEEGNLTVVCEAAGQQTAAVLSDGLDARRRVARAVHAGPSGNRYSVVDAGNISLL